MTKRILFMCFLLFFLFCLTPNVNAEDGSCTYSEKANLNKLAGSVETSLNITKNADGSDTFKISIYNITSELSVGIKNDYDSDFYLVVVSEMTNNGTYTFEVNDTTNVIKYDFVVRATSSNCTDDLKKMSVTKPKRNKYHDYNECKYADTENYSYCEEWITRDFSLSEKEILAKIEEQRSINKKITTTCANCSSEVKKDSRLELINMYKKFIVIGLSIGIALTMIYIYLKVSNIRRAEL